MLSNLGFTKHADVKKHYNYGKYVFKHKANIISPMLQVGLPLSQALAHDVYKLGPKEWGPYAEWMEGPTGRHGTQSPETFNKWRKAVKHHYAHSPHHYLKYGNPDNAPNKYKLEALADWYSVNKTKAQIKGNKQFPDFRHWYADKYYKLPLTPNVRKTVDARLNVFPAEYMKFLYQLKEKQDARRSHL
jgi:hypothetical protein